MFQERAFVEFVLHCDPARVNAVLRLDFLSCRRLVFAKEKGVTTHPLAMGSLQIPVPNVHVNCACVRGWRGVSNRIIY